MSPKPTPPSPPFSKDMLPTGESSLPHQHTLHDIRRWKENVGKVMADSGNVEIRYVELGKKETPQKMEYGSIRNSGDPWRRLPPHPTFRAVMKAGYGTTRTMPRVPVPRPSSGPVSPPPSSHRKCSHSTSNHGSAPKSERRKGEKEGQQARTIADGRSRKVVQMMNSSPYCAFVSSGFRAYTTRFQI